MDDKGGVKCPSLKPLSFKFEVGGAFAGPNRPPSSSWDEGRQISAGSRLSAASIPRSSLSALDYIADGRQTRREAELRLKQAKEAEAPLTERHELWSHTFGPEPAAAWMPVRYTPPPSVNSQAETPSRCRLQSGDSSRCVMLGVRESSREAPMTPRTSITPMPMRSVSARSNSPPTFAQRTVFESVDYSQGPYSARAPSSRAARAESRENERPRIRVIVRLPAASRVMILVDPRARVGPHDDKKSDMFDTLWGEGAEKRGPYAGKMPEGGRLTPVKALLAEQFAATGEFEESQAHHLLEAFWSAEPGERQQAPQDIRVPSLKELVEVATGVPVNEQKLCFGMRGPLDNDASLLCECDVVDGSIVRLTVKPGSKPVHTPRKSRKSPSGPASGKIPESRETSPSQSSRSAFLQKFSQVVSGKSIGRSTSLRRSEVVLEAIPEWRS